MRRGSTDRSGAVTVEAALVLPVMLLVLLALLAGGVGVFRFQQVAGQAREAARRAAVRGSDWEKETKQKSPTARQIFDESVVPLAAGMDSERLDFQLWWVSPTTGEAIEWDKASRDPLVLSRGEYRAATVRATLHYDWFPGVLGLGVIRLSTTCELPMSF